MNQQAAGARSGSEVRFSFKTRTTKVGGFTIIVNLYIIPHSLVKRRKPTRGVMHFPDQDKCAVCNNSAGPHIYYGARVSRGRGKRDKYCHHSSHQACLPCRAFFKRSVEQDQAYICHGASNCVVAHNARKTCKYCRFQVRWD